MRYNSLLGRLENPRAGNPTAYARCLDPLYSRLESVEIQIVKGDTRWATASAAMSCSGVRTSTCTLDVYFISSSPVEPCIDDTVWGDRKHVQIVEV
jgi:hypothetical protein